MNGLAVAAGVVGVAGLAAGGAYAYRHRGAVSDKLHAVGGMFHQQVKPPPDTRSDAEKALDQWKARLERGVRGTLSDAPGTVAAAASATATTTGIGAVIGGAIGTVFPVVGNVGGAAIGAVSGAEFGVFWVAPVVGAVSVFKNFLT